MTWVCKKKWMCPPCRNLKISITRECTMHNEENSLYMPFIPQFPNINSLNKVVLVNNQIVKEHRDYCNSWSSGPPTWPLHDKILDGNKQQCNDG